MNEDVSPQKNGDFPLPIMLIFVEGGTLRVFIENPTVLPRWWVTCCALRQKPVRRRTPLCDWIGGDLWYFCVNLVDSA